MSIDAVGGMQFSPAMQSLTGESRKAVDSLEEFSKVLQSQITETDRLQQESAEMTRQAALGNAGVSLHDAQIAAAKAEVNLLYMVQLRNKAVEVYKEIMNMPV